MKLKIILPIALSHIFFAANSQAQKQERTSPNLIIILADDLGNADVGFNGCKDIPTPNIDRIAQNGVRFTNGYFKKWESKVIDPIFMGLGDDDKYNEIYPDRFKKPTKK